MITAVRWAFDRRVLVARARVASAAASILIRLVCERRRRCRYRSKHQRKQQSQRKCLHVSFLSSRGLRFYYFFSSFFAGEAVEGAAVEAGAFTGRGPRC